MDLQDINIKVQIGLFSVIFDPQMGLFQLLLRLFFNNMLIGEKASILEIK